jgi:hypothetical protein
MSADSDLIAKEEKVLVAVAESVGSTIGSLAAGATNAAMKILPSPATRRRVIKRAKATRSSARKTAKKVKKRVAKVAAKGRRQSKATLRKAARTVRKARRRLSR